MQANQIRAESGASQIRADLRVVLANRRHAWNDASQSEHCLKLCQPIKIKLTLVLANYSEAESSATQSEQWLE